MSREYKDELIEEKIMLNDFWKVEMHFKSKKILAFIFLRVYLPIIVHKKMLNIFKPWVLVPAFKPDL